jgi:excisionase family DNA binding protein
MDRLLKLSEVAKLLSVCEKTLRRWDKDGKLPAVKTIGGHRRYKLKDIEIIIYESKT